MVIYPSVEALNELGRYYKETGIHPTLLRCGLRAYLQLMDTGDCVLGEDGQWRLNFARVIVDPKVANFLADMEPVVQGEAKP